MKLLLLAVAIYLAQGQNADDFVNIDLTDLIEEEKNEVDKTVKKVMDLLNLIKTKGRKTNELEIRLKSVDIFREKIIDDEIVDLKLSVEIDGKPQVCRLYLTCVRPWENGGTCGVEAQTADDPCAPYNNPLLST